jgi:hypothetical protein
VHTRRLILMLGWIVGSGCDTNDGNTPGPDAANDASSEASVDAEQPASVELGTGEVEFEPVVPDQHLKLYAGTQGGHHVWLSYRTQGLEPKSIRMTLDVVPEANARMAHSEVELNLDSVEGDPEQSEFVGWPAQILDPECAVGSPVSIQLTLTDKRGKQASGEMRVIPDPPDTGFTRTCTR